MKKVLFIFALSLTCICANAEGTKYRTTCGKEGMTVGPSFFEDGYKGLNEYLAALNEELCNEPGNPYYRIE